MRLTGQATCLNNIREDPLLSIFTRRALLEAIICHDRKN